MIFSFDCCIRYGGGPTRFTHASTQRPIGFAFGARGSGLGSPCLASRRRHHEYDGPGYAGSPLWLRHRHVRRLHCAYKRCAGAILLTASRRCNWRAGGIPRHCVDSSNMDGFRIRMFLRIGCRILLARGPLGINQTHDVYSLLRSVFRDDGRIPDALLKAKV
jgi:hypothetical protein